MKRIVQNPKTWLYVVCHGALILVGLVLCHEQPNNTAGFAVGASLMAAGLAGWVVFAHVLISQNVSEQLDMLFGFGVERIFDARSVRIRTEYVCRLEAARDRIDVIGFGLSAFREDFSEEFAKWKERATIRILLIDPEFPTSGCTYAAQRDREENNPPGKIAADVRKFVNDVGNLMTSEGVRVFEVRLYRCLPAVNILRVDNELFWGPYLLEPSRNSPTFLVRKGGLLYERFTRQFDRIWENEELSRSVPNEWLLKKA
jgi:hypothetical protein